MMNLRSFFKVVFANEQISDEKLAKFTEIHIQKMAANNNNGRYTTLITEASAAYEAYFGAVKEEDTKYAVQQSHTKSMQAVFEEFKKTVSQKEGAVRSNWNVDSPTYQEFFPLGVTEYSTSTLANVELLMNRMVTAARAHEKELGEAFLTIFTDIETRFIAARTTQLHKKGEVSGSKDAAARKRDNLERQLMKNLLTLALEYMGDPDRGMDFFDQSFIHKVGGKEEDGEEEIKPNNV